MDKQTDMVSNHLLVGLQELFAERRHCDIKVQIQKEVFVCHKVVLSAASKYFDAMFSSGMQESKSDKVTLNDISASVFQDILSFVYYGHNVINVDNVEDLLHASCLLQISYLKDQCEEFLLDQLSPENCVGFWIISRTLSCDKLQKSAWEYILNNFDEVSKSEELIKLDKDDLVAIIRDDSLRVMSEETVYQTALRWMRSDERRGQAIAEILPEIRLSQVSLDFILDDIYSNPLVHTNEKCMKLVKNAIKYHALPERRHTFKSLDVKLRNTWNQVSLFVVIGRRQSNFGSDVTEAIAYNAKDDQWYTLCAMPCDIGEEFATCPYGNDMFVSGGTSQSEACYRFSAKQYKWLEMSRMSQGRYRHCMVAVRDSLYAIGGYNFGTVGSVEEFDISSNTWQTVGELKHAVDAASATVHKEKIFVFGGWQGFSEESAAIQCFDTDTRTCFILNNLPSPRKDTRALTYDNKSYVVCSNGEILSFSADQTLKKVEKINNFQRKNFGVYRDGNTLYVIGGLKIEEYSNEEDSKISDEIIAVSGTKNETVSIRGPLPAPFEVFGCYKTVIKAKYPLVEFAEQFEYM